MSALSSLIFPSQATSTSQTLSQLKQRTLSIPNRLQSILADSSFVCAVSEAYSLPLIANERCGSWYIPPQRKAGSAYFKSTDGHAGQWAFSLRRLNLEVLKVIGKEGGCIIIDSTRRGKSMPDALSKTAPIWCAIINRILFPDNSQCHVLRTPPSAVSLSENSQIEARLDSFVAQFRTLKLNLPPISKPLRPIWVIQGDLLPEEAPQFDDFHPVVLCTASRRVQGGELSEGGYIQGAGDDAEGWSHGLTAPVFWENKDWLLECAEDQLPNLIEDLMADFKSSQKPTELTLVKPTTQLYIGKIGDVDPGKLSDHDALIVCGPGPVDETFSKALKSRYLQFECRHRKLGSRDLRERISALPSFMRDNHNMKRLFVCCQDGKDLSVGAALAVLCLYYNDAGEISIQEPMERRQMDKQFIRQRLSWIVTSAPAASPTRPTLQSINDFLFSVASRQSAGMPTCP